MWRPLILSILELMFVGRGQAFWEGKDPEWLPVPYGAPYAEFFYNPSLPMCPKDGRPHCYMCNYGFDSDLQHAHSIDNVARKFCCIHHNRAWKRGTALFWQYGAYHTAWFQGLSDWSERGAELYSFKYYTEDPCTGQPIPASYQGTATQLPYQPWSFYNTTWGSTQDKLNRDPAEAMYAKPAGDGDLPWCPPDGYPHCNNCKQSDGGYGPKDTNVKILHGCCVGHYGAWQEKKSLLRYFQDQQGSKPPYLQFDNDDCTGEELSQLPDPYVPLSLRLWYTENPTTTQAPTTTTLRPKFVDPMPSHWEHGGCSYPGGRCDTRDGTQCLCCQTFADWEVCESHRPRAWG